MADRWLVIEATRNGRPTTTLKDAFFDFSSDSTMVTNIFGADQSYPYQIHGKSIEQYGTQEVTYSIDYQVTDTIVLSAQIYSYAFSFLAIRDTSSVENTSN